MEAEWQQPMSVDSSTELPDSSPISIQLLSSPPSFDKTCAPSQAPTTFFGRLDYLSYGRLH